MCFVFPGRPKSCRENVHSAPFVQKLALSSVWIEGSAVGERTPDARSPENHPDYLHCRDWHTEQARYTWRPGLHGYLLRAGTGSARPSTLRSTCSGRGRWRPVPDACRTQRCRTGSACTRLQRRHTHRRRRQSRGQHVGGSRKTLRADNMHLISRACASRQICLTGQVYSVLSSDSHVHLTS